MAVIGSYHYLKNQTEDVVCVSANFGGDPINGVAKKCYIKTLETSDPTNPTALHETDYEHALKIYPNPTKGSFTIEINKEQPTEISIYNIVV